jgi:hypothetical protein
MNKLITASVALASLAALQPALAESTRQQSVTNQTGLLVVARDRAGDESAGFQVAVTADSTNRNQADEISGKGPEAGSASKLGAPSQTFRSPYEPTAEHYRAMPTAEYVEPF